MEDKENEIKATEQDTEKVDETKTEETESEAETSQGSDLDAIKDAYEAKLKRVTEEAEKAKKQYEADLAKRTKMIADLIGNEANAQATNATFEKIIKARENNKRY